MSDTLTTLVFLTILVLVVYIIFYNSSFLTNNKQTNVSDSTPNPIRTFTIENKLLTDISFVIRIPRTTIKSNLSSLIEKSNVDPMELVDPSTPTILTIEWDTYPISDIVKSQTTSVLNVKDGELDVIVNGSVFKTISTSTTDRKSCVGSIGTKMLYNIAPIQIGGGGGNNIQYIIINNNTSIPLSFNKSIHISPHKFVRFNGTGSFTTSGIPLGFVFKNDQGLYPDLEVDRMMNMISYS